MGHLNIGPRDGTRVAWTTDAAPVDLSDGARRRLWHDIFDAALGPFSDVDHAHDRPLSARFEFRRLGALRVARFCGTMTRVARTRAAIAGIDEPLVCLGINRGGAILLSQGGREALLPAGQCAAVMWTESRPSDIRLAPDSAWVTLDVPPGELTDRLGGHVGHIEARLAHVINEPSPVLRHLVCYVDLLFEPDLSGAGELFAEHAAAHVLDLMALVLGAQGDAAEMAQRRGLRAARLQAVIAAIAKRYSDPAFSVRRLAAQLGLSRRYVHELLHDSGASFQERILELRLRKARIMLSSRLGAGMAIMDIAYACGFSDVSYFNRCFRRRFGMTPTAARDAPSSGGPPA